MCVMDVHYTCVVAFLVVTVMCKFIIDSSYIIHINRLVLMLKTTVIVSNNSL